MTSSTGDGIIEYTAASRAVDFQLFLWRAIYVDWYWTLYLLVIFE